MGKGWIKLHRKILNNKELRDKPYCKFGAFVDLLLLANYEDSKKLKRGQVGYSTYQLADRWGWSRPKLYRFLKTLKDDGCISISGNERGIIITIINFNEYQNGVTTDVTTGVTTDVTTNVTTGVTTESIVNTDKIHDMRTTDVTTGVTTGVTTNVTTNRTHYKNKRIKEVKNNIYSATPELNQAILDFIEQRKKIKKPMTDRAIELFVKRLDSLDDSTAGKIELINTAIERGWQTVYPKSDREQKPKQTTFGSHTQQTYDFEALKRLKG